MFNCRKARLTAALMLPLWLMVASACASKKSFSTVESSAADACALALIPHSGEAPIDRDIARYQEAARKATEPTRAIEQLGWAFIRKSRASNDPGFYKLAEQCAICLESKRANSAQALLLRAHALNNLHRFKEAEALGRELTAIRGLPIDYGVFGDSLMEQGRLDQAVEAYQKMIDLKPGPQSYGRGAHIRWLRGDVAGAIELMRMAAKAGAPKDEAAAWAYSKLALYALQRGAVKVALGACDVALQIQRDYAPALLAKGRVMLAEGMTSEAIEQLALGARLNPLPEYEWALADALRAGNRLDAAVAVEQALEAKGPATDPRTFALYLATRGKDPETALALAREELTARQDVFTLDALAWSLAAAGRTGEASAAMKRALAEGTQDARLFLHAGRIAALAGDKKQARRWLAKAGAIKQMLLPSEREQLSASLAAL
jgi:tetratricopeptide (TPR) repeat protein